MFDISALLDKLADRYTLIFDGIPYVFIKEASKKNRQSNELKGHILILLFLNNQYRIQGAQVAKNVY